MEKYMVSGYWRNNLGDDLFLKILCERFPNSTFYTHIDKEFKSSFSDIKNLKLISSSNVVYKVLNKLLNFLNVPLISDFYTILFFEQYIEIGGSIFMQDENWKQKFRRRNFISKYVKDYYVIGSNFGPFDSGTYLESYFKLFNSINKVSFRDYKSKQFFGGIDTINVAPDAILSLDRQKSKIYEESKTNYILISVIDLITKKASRSEELNLLVDDYEYQIAEITRKYIGNNLDVVLMSFCDFEEDNLAIARILKLLPKEVSDKVDVFQHKTIDDSLNMIKNAKKIISTRFHGMILGWLYRIPTFVITYSEKTKFVINELYDEQSYCDIRKFTSLSFSCIESNFSIIPKDKIDEICYASHNQFLFVDKHESMMN